MEITQNTYSIHHFSALWHSKLDTLILKIDSNSYTRLNIEHKIRRTISFPLRVANKIKTIGINNSIMLMKDKIKDYRK